MGWAVTRGALLAVSTELFLPALCAAVGVSSGPGRAPHPTVRARGIPAPRLCKHRDWAKACYGTLSASPQPDCGSSQAGRGFSFPPTGKLHQHKGAQRAPLPRGRSGGAGVAPAAGSTWRGGPVAPGPHAGPGAATLLSGRGRGLRRPRPQTRPRRGAGTQRRHVRAAGSWQVSKTDRPFDGGLATFPRFYGGKKKGIFLNISI